MTEIIFRALPIVASLLFLFYLFSVIRSRKIKERYLYKWLFLGVVLLLASIFPQSLFWLAETLGFKVAANLIFTVAIFILMFAVLHLSKTASTHEENQRRLVEEIAILNDQVRSLAASIEKADGAAPQESSSKE